MSQPRAQLPAVQARLFTPEGRLGWVFRDPRDLARPYGAPEPMPRPVPAYLTQQAEQAKATFKRQLGLAVKIFGVLAGVFLLMAGCTAALGGSYGGAAAMTLVGVAVLAALPGVIMVGVAATKRSSTTGELEETQRFHAKEHEAAHAEWRAGKAEHDRAWADLIAAGSEWGSAQAAARRLDVFGGGLFGWEALLTVHGASLLSQHPVLVIDLSREVVCGELAGLARAAGVVVHTELLPEQLAASRLCDGLGAGQLVDVIVESMHGGEGTAAASRAERSMDHRILSGVAGVLGEDMSLARLSAGVRTLLGDEQAEQLTVDELEQMTHGLFSTEYLEQARPALTRIESYLYPLQTLGASRTPTPGAALLTCIAIAEAGRGPGTELLTDLIVQWVTHRIAETAEHIPALIVVGADELARHHTERLSDVCERRHVPLTLLFRHLREASLHVLGGGAVAFMRLGNHEEATRAADFIGREHKFVLSTLTRTLGGNQTHTTTDTVGHGESRGTSKSRGASRSDTFDNVSMLVDPVSFTKAFTSSKSKSKSTTRNWSTAKSYADGSNWSDASAQQRVYEYAVEPTTLQNLPDYALLLAETGAGQGVRVTPADCNPAIITLPRVSTDPLPALPNPQPRQLGQAPTPTAEPWQTSEAPPRTVAPPHPRPGTAARPFGPPGTATPQPNPPPGATPSDAMPPGARPRRPGAPPPGGDGSERGSGQPPGWSW